MAEDIQPVSIVDTGHRREWDLSIEVTSQPLGPIASHEMWDEVYDRIVELAADHRTTLVFVNTRRLVERVAHQLTTRLGQGKVAAHHGSLSRAIRLEAEQGLKSGAVPAAASVADRWAQFAEDLHRCERETFLSRVVCDQRVRIRYCDGYWGKVPQCPGGVANPDRGQ